MYERQPALDSVRATAGDAGLAGPIKPLLHVRNQEESSHDKVIHQDGRDTLVIILRAGDILLDERVVDFKSWGRAEGRRI